jgi:23S rRNA pseudouridine1911/1915/1917 synthase
MSRRKAQEVIEKGQVMVDGTTVLDKGRAVSDDATLVWDPHAKARRRARISLPILYEDESILVVDKPAGLLAVPTSPEATDEDTALARVQDYVRHLTPRRPYVGIVHRIDRDTSGALAFALAPAARPALRALFREHRTRAA